MSLDFEREIVINETAFLVSATDSNGKIIFANDEFCRISEFDKDELIGMPHDIMRHSDMSKDLCDNVWSTIKSGKAWSGYIKNRTKHGNFYWALANIYPFKNEIGEQCYISCRRYPVKLKQDTIDYGHQNYPRA